MTLMKRMTAAFAENTAAREAAPNAMIPMMRILCLPVLSASLPNGTENAAIISEYAVMSQPTDAAPMLKYVPISGMDRFNALPEKLVIKAVLVPMRTAVDFFDFDRFCSSMIFATPSFHF